MLWSQLVRAARFCGIVILVVVFAPLSVALCAPNAELDVIDLTDLGGDLSSDLAGRHALQVHAPNVSSSERVEAQASGFPLFHREVSVSEGLGPRFINNSCAGCHVNNGRGPTRFRSAPFGGSTMVVKAKLPGLLPDGRAPEVPGIGSQVLDHQVDGAKPVKIQLAWIPVVGRYPDGRPYRLRKPRLTFVNGPTLPAGAIVSLRMSPPMVGLGLLEAIPMREILLASDPSDRDRDGISGRVNFVKDVSNGRYTVGRFGFKATQPSVLNQSAAALYKDMQITNPLFNDGAKPEASLADLHSLAIYLRLAGVPKARGQGAPDVIAGQRLFKQISCDACHRMTVTTGEHPDPELAKQTIHPFTDLLLHDMGPGLADNWSEFGANGREWRTTPLWGLGFTNRLAGGKAVYLHDGRARTIEEAILWHDGEAAQSQNAFKALPLAQRQQLLAFLKSL